MKKLTTYSFLCATILFSTSFCKFNWVGLNLSNNDITNCINFQLTRGGNCIGDFNKLTGILDRFIAEKYSVDRLAEVLGNPNESIGKSALVYNLTDNKAGIKATLVVNNSELVSYSVK